MNEALDGRKGNYQEAMEVMQALDHNALRSGRQIVHRGDHVYYLGRGESLPRPPIPRASR